MAEKKESRTVVVRLSTTGSLKGYNGKDYGPLDELKVTESEADAWRAILTRVCTAKSCKNLAVRGKLCAEHQPKPKA